MFGKVMMLLPALAVGIGLSALNWPVTPEEELRAQALEDIASLAQDFPATADAAAAGRLLDAVETQRPYEWIGTVIDFTSGVLERHPPASGDEDIRRAALLILDYPLHVDNKSDQAPPELRDAWQQAVDRLHQRAMARILAEMAVAEPGEGAVVWKFYNMGFAVKTAKHTIGFDLWPGAVSGRLYTPEQLDFLVGELDLLLISHEHGDHVSRQLAEAMLAAGKPVIAPDAGAVLPGVDHPLLRTLYAPGAVTAVGDIRIAAVPGSQGATPCNIYAVTLDGVTVTHNGDNTDHAAYRTLREMEAADIALSNCWSGFAPYFAATRPALAVTAHENELSHRVQNRESFREVFQRLEEAGEIPPLRVIDCGESVHWRPKRP